MMMFSYRVRLKEMNMVLSVSLLTDMIDKRPFSLPIEAMNPIMILNTLYTQDINI